MNSKKNDPLFINISETNRKKITRKQNKKEKIFVIFEFL